MLNTRTSSASLALAVAASLCSDVARAQCGWGLCGAVTPPGQHAQSSLLHFARALAADGATVIAGSPGYSAAYPASGQASISSWNGAAWEIEAVLTPSSPQAGDDFGRSVALSGDLAVVGAPLYGAGGAAFVFERHLAQGWSLVAEHLGAPGSDTGRSVALCGTTVVVGAPGLGVVTLLAPVGGAWQSSATLLAPDDDDPPAASPGFGTSVASDGLRIAVGDPEDEAVTVFEFASNNWIARSVLDVPQGFEDDGFGTAVALRESTLLVGAPGHDDDPGAAFHFALQSGQWVAGGALQPPAPFIGAEFGGAVALSAGAAIVGAPKAGGGLGASFVFDPQSAQWSLVEAIVPKPTSAKGKFGSAVAASGPWVLSSIGLDEIGLYGYSGTQATYVGAAWSASNTGQSCEPFLLGYPGQLSASLGGEHSFHASAGAGGAGSLYAILGSASGTAPGFTLGTTTVPLQPDWYFQSCLALPNQGVFAGTLGVFATNEIAYGALTVPAGLTNVAGIVLDHALVVLAPTGEFRASPPTRLEIVP